MNNKLLFVESVAEDSTPNWPSEFEAQSYRLKLKHNNPFLTSTDPTIRPNYNLWAFIDCRSTLTEVKSRICSGLNCEPDSIILRRGGKLG